MLCRAPDWHQDVRHLSLAVRSPAGEESTVNRLHWNAGDVAWLLPENDPACVNALCKRLRLNDADRLTISRFAR